MLSAAFDDDSPRGGDIVTGLSVAAGRFASADGGRYLARFLQLFGPSVRQEQRVLDALRCVANGDEIGCDGGTSVVPTGPTFPVPGAGSISLPLKVTTTGVHWGPGFCR